MKLLVEGAVAAIDQEVTEPLRSEIYLPIKMVVKIFAGNS
jgi:hypothetical protein